ncbi:MAG: tetratricopeptide repeat protein [Sedimentisphaerales bacterium]|nr:tetratricopeptide repeat protein [Sedimentisphaerales bacterium]
MIEIERVDIEHYLPYIKTQIEAIGMVKRTITRRWETDCSKRILSILTTGFIVCAFHCRFFQSAAFSQADEKQRTTSTVPNSKEQVKSELTPEQKIAALKKEELELAENLVKDFPNSTNPVMLMGNLWERHGDATRALEYFNKVLEKDPERPDVYKSIGWFYMNKEQYEQAIDYWQKALEIDPNTPGVHHNIALALMGQNKQSQAVGELEKDIQISPGSASSHFLLGQLYLRQKEYEKAGDNYEKAIENEPNYTNAYYGLFTLSTRLKQQDKAKTYMAIFKKLKAEDMKVLKDRNKAVVDLMDMQKGAAETYLLAGQMYQAGGNFQKAEEFLKRATTLDPNNVLCLEKLASFYLTSNRITDAISLYGRIGEINPKDPLCHLNIGILSMRLKQLGNAEKAFRKVIEVAPESSSGYRELAQLYLRAGTGYPEARALAEKAVALEPTALNYFVLSWARDMNGETENALKAIEKAIQLEPANMKYRNVYEHIKSKN